MDQISKRNFYSKDQVIFEPGPATAIWVLDSGEACLYLRYPDNEAGESRIVLPGEVLGITEALAEIPFTTTLQAKSSCVFICVDDNDFVALLREEPLLRAKLLKLLSKANIIAWKKLAGHPPV